MAAPFGTDIDWNNPAGFYLGQPEMVALANAEITLQSGMQLPVHSFVLASHSGVLRGLFLSMKEGPSVGAKRKQKDTAAVQLKTPFSKYSKEVVVYFLRFVFNPTDASVANLANEKVAPHAGGIIRLMHALDVSAAGPLWWAAMEYMKNVVSSSDITALEYWLELADDIKAELAWAEGIRSLAKIILTHQNGCAGAFAAVKELGTRFNQDVCLAVLAAVASGALQASEADKGANRGSSLAAQFVPRSVSSLSPASPAARVVSSLPPASLLADWSEKDSEESDIPMAYIWTLPGFPGCVATRKASPDFEACGRTWQLENLPAPDDRGYLELYLNISPSVKQFLALKVEFVLELFGDLWDPLIHEFTMENESYGFSKFIKLSEITPDSGYIHDGAIVIKVRIKRAA